MNFVYEKLADTDGYFFFKHENPLIANYSKNIIPHFHDSIEFFIIEKGEFSISIAGEEKTMKAGDIFFIDGFTRHAVEIPKSADFSLYCAVASAKYFEGISWFRDMTLSPYSEKKKGFEEILAFIKWAYHLKGKMNDDMREGFVKMLFGLLYDYLGPIPRRSDKSKSALIEIIKYIGDNFAENITLDGLSQKFGYEKTYLSKLLSKTVGMNLREYLGRLRIARLETIRKKAPELPLTAIYEECGFKSESTFFRAYRKYGTLKRNF